MMARKIEFTKRELWGYTMPQHLSEPVNKEVANRNLHEERVILNNIWDFLQVEILTPGRQLTAEELTGIQQSIAGVIGVIEDQIWKEKENGQSKVYGS